MSNPSFPVGDRRVEDPQKDLPVRVAPRAHLGTGPASLPMVVSHASSQHSEMLKSYQVSMAVTKSVARPIAPAPGVQGIGTSIKPAAHQISGLTPAVLKKEGQKPLSLTSTSSVTPVIGPSGSTAPNIIEISSTSASHGISTLQVPNVSSIIRGQPVTVHHHSTPGFSHLPRGMVAASHLVKPGPKMISVPRSGTPTTIQLPVSSAHTGTLPPGLHSQIRGALLPQGLRAAAPPVNRPASPAVSIGTSQSTDIHRQNVSLHTITTTSTTPSIQITLQASRTGEIAGKPVTTFQPAKLHVNQGLNMTSQPKVVMSQPVTPVMHHQTLAAKANKGAPMSSPLSTVTVSLSTATVTIPIISGTTSSSTIPIAKVPPQRQHQAQAISIPTPTTITTTHDHRTEPTSYPHPQPPQAHSQSHSQTHAQTAGHGQQQAHGQPATSIYVPQPQKATPVASSLPNTVHTEAREGLPTMPFFPYMFASDNPYYQHLLRYQVAAVAAQGRSNMVPAHTTASTVPLQGVTSPSVTQSSASSGRLNPSMLVMPDSLRHASPQTAQTQYVPTSSDGGSTGISTSISDTINSTFSALPINSLSGNSIATVAAVASSLYTATSLPQTVPQIGQQAPNTPSSTPVNNPSASPRPSILRKRTNEGISAVKKQLAMTASSNDAHHSPRPEPRPDSTPQSNMSSPKTPASGESQSSTDTALSSEATTPVQTTNDVKVKQEPSETQENGFLSNTEASPRKKPRKQLLNATEELKDIPVTINDFDKLVEACVKEESPLLDDIQHEMRDEYVDDDGVRWSLEKNRSPVTLMGFYNISWKPRNNHFQRYTDVKQKDERRPTVNELSNQKGVAQKASGWKLFHMAAQIEDLVELEKELHRNVTELQSVVAPHPPMRHSLLEDESGMLHELTQGNIQRCQLITDQLGDVKSSMLKVLDHKQRITEIVQKHISKRPIKKKERS